MKRNRLIAGAFDVFSFVLVAGVLSLAWITPAYAYVDPSVMTYTIQALAGVAVALSAVLGVALRRTRKMLFKMLKIDENAGKVVEAPVHRLDKDGKPILAPGEIAADAESMSSKKASRKGRASDDYPRAKWGARVVCALIVCAFFSFTLLVVPPYEIVAGAGADLVFGLSDIWPIFAVAGVVVAVVLALAVSLLRGRAFDIVLLFLFALGVAAYVQVLLLNSELPTADGKSVNWGDYTSIMLVSTVVWIVIVAIPLVVGHLKTSLARGGAVALSLALIIVQGVGVGSLFASGAFEAATKEPDQVNVADLRMTEDGLFTVSEKSNVIVFVLDFTDTKQMSQIMQEHPEEFNDWTGFTWYNNVAGSMVPTRYGVPFLLTGQLPQQGELFSQYLATRYERSTYLDDIHNAGYSMGIYTDTFGTEYSSEDVQRHVAGLTMNYHPMNQEDSPSLLDEQGTLFTLWKCAMYRDLPWAFKPYFWFYTDEVNNGMTLQVESDDGEVQQSTLYTMNDGAYYDKLKTTKLSATDDGETGAFRFIHLLGGHYPFNLDENGNDIGTDNSDAIRQIRGSLKMLSEYIRQLKDMGLYDNTAILVTSDHGDWGIYEDWDSSSNAIMFYKPAQSAEADAQPIKTVSTPVAHVNVQPTIIQAVGGDSSKYGETLAQVRSTAACVSSTRRRATVRTTSPSWNTTSPAGPPTSTTGTRREPSGTRSNSERRERTTPTTGAFKARPPFAFGCL